jgi:hypothetical protein
MFDAWLDRCHGRFRSGGEKITDHYGKPQDKLAPFFGAEGQGAMNAQACRRSRCPTILHPGRGRQSTTATIKFDPDRPPPVAPVDKPDGV